MNHDFLLKTETVVNAAQSMQNQVVETSGSSNKSESNQVFSAEIGKQIGKHDSFLKKTEPNEINIESPQNVQSTSTQQTESQLAENGKPLPTEGEVAKVFVEQLLSDVDISPALKRELTQTVEQFVEAFLSEGEPEQSLEESIAVLITQVVKATQGQNVAQEGKAELNTKAISNNNITEFPSKTTAQGTIKNILQGIAEADTEVINSATKVTSTIVSETEKTVPIAVASKAEKVAGQTEQVERVQTVLQQIKEVILKDVNSDLPQKTDKASRIADLVKKMMPDKAPTNNQVQTTLNEQNKQSASKEVAASPSSLAQLRADILQALPTKPLASASTLESKSVEKTPVLNIKSDGINSEDKRTERLLQLVDLIKPAKVDEASPKSVNFERAAPAPTPTVLTASPTTVTSSPTKADPPTLDIQPSLQSKAWNRVLSSRVVWMASEGIQQAALKLNPANLGPVEVRLHLQNEQASVSFIAQNAATRDALEQALPRLRESFIENGLELADADVSDQASHEANEDGSQNNNKDSQSNDVVSINGDETSSEQAVTDVNQENELGVNVYA